MKKKFFLSACLILTGCLHAQSPVESPVFLIDGAEIPTIGLKSAGQTNDSLIPWSLPDTIIGSKAAGEYAMYVYTYDERGNAVVTEAFQRVGNTWMPSQRIESTFNRWDLIDTTVNYLFRQGVYDTVARKISTYDRQGRHLTLLNQTWNANSKIWVSESQFLYEYTDDGRLKSSLKEVPHALIMDKWSKDEKMEYAYDTEGREISFEMSRWNGEWQAYRAYYRTYENGRIIKELGRILNEITGSFGDTYRFEYTYNEKGYLTDYIQFYTDSIGQWKGDTNLHRTLVYNADNLVTEECTRVYDAALGELENSTREYYFYNDDNQKDSVVHEVWLSLEWVHTISVRYFFNETGTQNGRIYYNLSDDNRRTDKYEFSFNEKGDGTLSECFTLQNDNWVPADRYDLEVHNRDAELILRSNELLLCKIRVHYADGFKAPGPLPDTTKPDDTTAIEPSKAMLDARVNVYPNPAVETLFVEISGEGTCDVTLSDLSGRTVEAFRMAAGHKAINVSRYKGTFILHVRKADTVIARKIVIL